MAIVISRRAIFNVIPATIIKQRNVSRMIHGEHCASDDMKKVWKEKMKVYETHEVVFKEAYMFYECMLDNEGVNEEMIMHFKRVREIAEKVPIYKELVEDMINDAQDVRIFQECFRA